VVPEAWKEWCCCDWDGDGHFNMQNYAKAGLPTLGQTVAFTKLVDCAAVNACFLIVLSSTNRRAAGAVLSGASLVLSHGVSAETAWGEMLRANPLPSQDPTVAWDRFPGPFTKSGKTTANSLTVLDCLSGLQYARDLGWICLYGDQAFDLAEWNILRRKFDASWVIPGEVLALAHPLETAKNPAFPGLLESAAVPNTAVTDVNKNNPFPKFPLQVRQVRANSEDSTSSPVSSLASPRIENCVDSWDIDYGDSYVCDIDSPSIQLVGLDDVDTKENLDDDIIPCRSHVVQPVVGRKAWDEIVFGANSPKAVRLMNNSFYSLCAEENVTSVFRLNYMYECPKQDECLADFLRIGIDVHDSAFTDGEVPSKKLIKGFLASCRKARKTGQARIAMHCMAGLGRTGSLLGAYAVAHHKMPGKAFHGWVRMCRPGSVQTEAQERFLRGLTPPRESTSVLKISSATGMANAFRKVTSWGSNMSFGSNLSFGPSSTAAGA
jgi:protein-tyrosine phosphatase